MNDSKKSKWEAHFTFQSNIYEKSITPVKDLYFEINLDTEKVDEGIHFKGFSIITPILTIKEAKSFAQEKANRILDYMSAIHNYSIEASFNLISEIKPPGELKLVESTFTINGILYKSIDLNLNDESLKNLLGGKNVKLMKQLSHYRRGLKTDDIINKIRDFYLIIEDDYPTNHPFRKKYSYIRHLQSHPRTIKRARKFALRLLGKDYMDPSNPNDLEKIKTDAEAIKREAKKIIDSNLAII